MRQQFRLINIDKMETNGAGQCLWSNHHDNALDGAGECSWSHHHHDLVERLAVPVDPTEWAELKTSPSRTNLRSQTSPLFKLPVELLDVIAKQIVQYAHILSFGLACTKLWEATESARDQSLRYHLQRLSWAGDRIILLGDHSLSWPKGVFSEAEVDWLDDLRDNDETYAELYYRLARKLDDPYASPYLLCDENFYLIALQCKDQLRANPEAGTWISFKPAYWTLQWAPSTSPDARWMLRNLSKREFVITSRNGNPSALSPVLCSLVGWFRDPSIAMEFPADEVVHGMIRGRWAGDRIDLTVDSLHDAQKAKDGFEWKDITDKVVERLERITMRIGGDWSAKEFQA